MKTKKTTYSEISKWRKKFNQDVNAVCDDIDRINRLIEKNLKKISESL